MITYRNLKPIVYTQKGTGKTVTVPIGYVSDGATGGFDVCHDSFFAHDWGCGNYLGKGPMPLGGIWDDGSAMTNFELSTMHSRLLIKCAFKQKRKTRTALLLAMSVWRWPVTFLGGGGAARKNMFFVGESC